MKHGNGNEIIDEDSDETKHISVEAEVEDMSEGPIGWGVGITEDRGKGWIGLDWMGGRILWVGVGGISWGFFLL